MFQLIQDKKTELQELCRKYHVVKLDLFGSAATEQFNELTSDLDFLVEFQPMGKGHFSAYFGLLTELQNLFPFPVDLVVESAIRNRYFREAINQNRQSLYAA